MRFGGCGGAGVILALGAALACGRAVADEPCASGAVDTVWVETTIRGDEMRLVDGRRLVFASVEAPRPRLAPGGDDPAGRAAARAAREALAERVEGREMRLLDLGEDRHGRRRGHLLDAASGDWVEAGLVAEGHLRVVPGRDDRACAAALLVPEGEAITARRGAWATRFAPIAAVGSDLAAIVGSYAVVEGRVVSVGRSGSRTFLNFGPDIRRDFAAVLNDKDLPGLTRRGVERDRLRGRTVRVRGIVEGRGAPRIVVEWPETIELVTR
jgi:hypothetical protein